MLSSWHSDIKPGNILFACDKYKLADPGYARFLKQEDFAGDVLPTTVLPGGTTSYGMHP